MKSFKWIIAVCMSGVGLWFVAYGAEWTLIRASFRAMASPGWLLFIPLAVGFEFIMRAIRWILLLSVFKRTSWRIFFPIIAVGFFLNNFLPFRSGEFVDRGRRCGSPGR